MKKGEKIFLGFTVIVIFVKFCFCWEYGFREFYGKSQPVTNESIYQLLFQPYVGEIEVFEDKQLFRVKEHPEVISNYQITYQDIRFYLATKESRQHQKNRFLKAVYGLRLSLLYLDEVNEMLKELFSDQDGYRMELMIELIDHRKEIPNQSLENELIKLVDNESGSCALEAHLYLAVDPNYTKSLEELAEYAVFELMQIFSDTAFNDLRVMIGETEMLEKLTNQSLMKCLTDKKELFLDRQSFSYLRYIYQGKISGQ